jgi:RNA polymerase sigma factor (sigma-70 family)
LLLSVVGRLAREGLVCPPDEALDLVHDFFADEVPTLLQRYDERRSAFSTYLYLAFHRFARRRLARRLRQAAILADARWCRDHAYEPGLVDALAASEVRQALEALSEGDRNLLLEYLDTDRPSERRMAASRHWSRYRLRTEIVEAFGKLAAQFARPTGVGLEDWKVAELAWKYGYTVDEAAKELGRRPSEVRAARDRCRQRLAALLLPRSADRGAKNDE